MKKMMMICLSLILAGAALLALGAATGADETVRLTLNGFVETEEAKTVTGGEGLTFDRLNVTADSASVEIVPGDRYGYTLENVSEGRYAVRQVGSELTIEINGDVDVALFPFADLIDERRIRVIVTTPGDAALDSLVAAVASGSLHIDRADARDMILAVASGNVTLDSARTSNAVISCASGRVDIDGIAADKMTVSIGSGRLSATGVDTDALTAQVVSGSLNLSGDLRGDTSVKVTSGNAALSFAAPIGEYRRSVSVTSGDVYVNGVKNPGNDTNSAAKNSLTASVTSGSLRLDFAN